MRPSPSLLRPRGAFARSAVADARQAADAGGQVCCPTPAWPPPATRHSEEVIEQLAKTSVARSPELFSSWTGLPPASCRRRRAGAGGVRRSSWTRRRADYCDGASATGCAKGIAALRGNPADAECGPAAQAQGTWNRGGPPRPGGSPLRSTSRHGAVGKSETDLLPSASQCQHHGGQLDQLISATTRPNPRSALTDLPVPLIPACAGGRRALWLPGTFPGLGEPCEPRRRPAPGSSRTGRRWRRASATITSATPAASTWRGTSSRSTRSLRMRIRGGPAARQGQRCRTSGRDAAPSSIRRGLDNLLVWEKRPYWEMTDPDFDVSKRT